MGNANFTHSRDFRQSRTYVVVWGPSAEFSPTVGAYLFVSAIYNEHVTDYPCRYLPKGWGGDPWFNADIESLARAQQVADAIGWRAWGALGQLGWDTDLIPAGGTTPIDLEVGDLIAFTNVQEGQDYAIYPVIEINPVSGTVGHPVYHLTVGEEAPDYNDIIGQITATKRIQEAING